MSIIVKNATPTLVLVPPSGWEFVELNGGKFYDLFARGHHLPRTQGRDSYKITISESCSVSVPNGIYVLENGATVSPDGTVQLQFGIHQNLVHRPDISVTPLATNETESINAEKLQKDCSALNPLYIPGKEPECGYYFDHLTRLKSLDEGESPKAFTEHGYLWASGADDDRWAPRAGRSVLYWSCPRLGSLYPMIDKPGCHCAHKWERVFKTEVSQ